MAVAYQRTRTLQNPPPRRAKKRRPLSDKQVKFFGTPAQKAALKRKRAATRTQAPAKKRRKAKKNPAEIVRAALAKTNPASTTKRRKKTVAKKAAKKRRRPAVKAARRNPPRRRTSKRTTMRKHTRRNPSPRNVGGFIANAAFMIAGAVGSKAGVQAILGASNTGWVGYAANLAAAFVIGKIVGMVTKNKQHENAAILGGVGQVVLRFLIDQTPYGSKLKSAGFGDYQFQSFVVPQRLANGMSNAQVAIPAAWRPQPVMMPAAVAAGGGGGVSGIKSVGRGLY